MNCICTYYMLCIMNKNNNKNIVLKNNNGNENNTMQLSTELYHELFVKRDT